MPRWLKHIFFVLLLVVFGGCAGSCSGCSGCGMTPLPGGFPKEKRIENSSSVRLTKGGLDFIAQNVSNLAPTLLGGAGQVNAGVVTFDVPKSSFDQSGFKGNVCPDGSNPTSNPPVCVVEADLGKAKLAFSTAAPHNLKINGTLAVRLQKLPVKGTFLGFIPINVEAVLTKGGVCNPKDYADIPVNVDISIETDTDPAHGGRQGYSRVKINAITIDNNAISSSITFCGGGIDDAIVNLIKGFLIGSLVGGLTDTLKDTVDDQLCTKEDPATGVTCPSGSYPDPGGVCRYCTPDGAGKCPNETAECVSMALGLDGNLSLAEALSSLSPGTKGGFDFMAAVGGEGKRDDGSGFTWGDLNPVGGGATLGMMGGAEPKPITQCVPIANLTMPTNIPVPDELQDPTKLIDLGIPNWTGPGPHFGFAVSERYMNYALGAVYNSGALCLGVGSGTLGSLLNSSTISLLIKSFEDLARQKQPAPLALVIRPQEPPSVVVGKGTDIATDPLLKVTMNKVNIDFYVWSSDRFIRAFTAIFDIVAPVNLDVTDAGLQPVLDKVEVKNPNITNALLREDEKTAAEALAGIISGQIGSALGGAISPIDLSSQLSQYGLELNIPPTVQGQGSPGLTKLEKGTDRFLGLFAGFSIATAPPSNIDSLTSDTGAEVSDKRIQAEGLSLATLRDDNTPEVELAVSSTRDDGAQQVEWQYRLDGELWHPWTYDRFIKLRSPVLALQARHKVEVRSRVAGRPETMDTTPAVLEVLIDRTPPSVELAKVVKDGGVRLDVTDSVSPREKLLVRWAFDGAPLGDWVSAAALDSIDVDSASSISLEAKDEEGNVASKQHELIRGKKDLSLGGGSSGCGCRVAGPTERTPWALLSLGFGLALAFFWRRQRSAPKRRPAARRDRSVRAVRVVGSVALMTLAASWSGCSCGSDDDDDSKKTKCPGLETCQVLEPGLVGAYASAATASDGTLWVAGYNDLGYGTTGSDTPEQFSWGDLVVGKWDGTKVAWESVDGLPAVDPELDPGSTGGPPDPKFNDVSGYRKGLTEPGDDVGLWTSIALVENQPIVAYFDAKNRGLKLARREGSSWTITSVQQKPNSDIGRYAKLALVGGKPVIAFLFIEPGDAGAAKSGVRFATASSASPGGPSDWTFADVYTDAATPCRAYLCKSGECRQDTGKCQAKSSGCGTCGTDEDCFDDAGTKTCAKTFGKTYPDSFPEAAGLYVSLAETKSGLGMVFYDRIHGNLMQSKQEAGKWSAPTILAGQGKDGSGADIDTGDVGMGASLFVDGAGDWHVAYANGFDETVQYMKIAGGTTPGAPEVVDDGIVPEGQVIVGDDTSIFVTSSGEVQIAYQDSTRGKARYATGAPNGAAHTWTKKDLGVSEFAGAFSTILSLEGKTQVMTWWRKAKPRTEGDITIVSP